MVVTSVIAITLAAFALASFGQIAWRQRLINQMGKTTAGVLTMACGGLLGVAAFGTVADAADAKPQLVEAEAGQDVEGTSFIDDTKKSPTEAMEIAPTSGEIRYLTKNRPSWVDALAKLKGETHSMTVSAGPYKNDALCKREMRSELRKAVRKYLEQYLGSSYAVGLVRVSDAEIRSFLVKERFQESLETSVGEMRQHHVKLEFDKRFQATLDDRWKRVTAWSRLLQIALAGAGVLGLLGLMYGYFRVDTATRGYYTRRLQFAATAAILALIAAGVVMAKWIPWI